MFEKFAAVLMAIADWIPVMEEAIWPVVTLLLALLFWKPLKAIFAAIRERIENGADLALGKEGFKLSEGSKKKLLEEGEEKRLVEASVEGHKKRGPRPLAMARKGGVENLVPDEVSHFLNEKYVYLAHRAGRAKNDADGTSRRDVALGLDADNGVLLNEVERVVYRLHPTFPNPVREVTTRENNFTFKFRAWGEFNVIAEVYCRGRSKPLLLYRYINF